VTAEIGPPRGAVSDLDSVQLLEVALDDARRGRLLYLPSAGRERIKGMWPTVTS
jgi:hypothetical protein